MYAPVRLLLSPLVLITVSGLGDLSSSEHNASHPQVPFSAIQLGDLALSLDKAADAVLLKPV